MYEVEKLVRLYKLPVIGKVAKKIAGIFGADIPTTVSIGANVRFPHNSIGSVIRYNTVIKDNAQIYQNVTIGRAEPDYNAVDKEPTKVTVGEGAILCTGCKVLCKGGDLIIGNNTIIGANSVLLQSTGDNEMWCGAPAKLVKINTK